MNKLSLVILDAEQEYLERVADFILETDFRDKLAVTFFTQVEEFEKYMDSNPIVHILLVNHKLALISYAELCNCTVFLSESVSMWDESNATLYKYQSLETLLSSCIQLYVKRNEASLVQISANRNTQVVSVYSTVGGCGKSTIAIQLSKELAKQGKKVLYLNAELFHTLEAVFAVGEEQNFSKALYYLKANSSQFIAKFELLKKQDARTGVYYLEPSSNPNELMEMTKQEMVQLINLLVTAGNYDMIIVDLESSLHERIIGALDRSDVIWWIVQDDLQCVTKTKQMWLELANQKKLFQTSLYHKTCFIMNKFKERLINEALVSELGISGMLPYISNWQTTASEEGEFLQEFFGNQCLQLYTSLSKNIEVQHGRG